MSAISQDVRFEMLRADVERCGPGAIDMFDTLMAQGESAEWAAMCACRQAPGAKNTDRAFQQGQRRKMEGMDPVNRRNLERIARRAGINPEGKYYMGSLGRYTDPKAWVSTADDVLTVAKQENLSVEGVVTHRGVTKDVAPKVGPKLAPDIVERLAQQKLQTDPALREKVKRQPKKIRELKEQVVEQHGPRS